jgi:hypothetical protein
MYEKNLTEDLRLRLSPLDMDFLRDQATDRGCSVSEVIRSIIGEYRRSLELVAMFKDAIDIQKLKALSETSNSTKGGQLSNGDTETNFDDFV